jgi:AbrB family looped-hinge helix DNA binding protein
MPAVKIGPKHQITIPKEVFDSLNLKVGDFMETQMKDNVIVLIPHKLVPKDQEWFWTKEWQDKEHEVDNEIARGEVSGPYATAKDLLKAIKK